MPIVTFVEAFSDNYHWLIIEGHHCAVVDPGDATPVIEYCEQHDLKCDYILCTHHHADHIGGVERLRKHYDASVYGISTPRTPPIDIEVQTGDTLDLSLIKTQLQVLETPGHTAKAATYYNDAWVFTGDTLFAGGCGRLFEGTPEQMYDSLQAILNLGEDQAIYCAHEYTLANLKFALSIEPDNKALRLRYESVKVMRAKNQCTLPSNLDLEQETNPFCRSHLRTFQEALAKVTGELITNPTEVLAMTRQLKDAY